MGTKMEIELDNSANQTIIDIDNGKFTLTTNLGENDYGRGKDNSTTTTSTGSTTTG